MKNLADIINKVHCAKPSTKTRVACLYCCEEFIALKSRRQRGKSKYCSRRCYLLGKRKGSTFLCLHCGQRFWRRPSEIEKGNNKFCSRSCYLVWQIGQPRSESFKETCRRKTKNKNPNWRGGITPVNKKIRNSKEYALWRDGVFRRDNFQCQKCNARNGEGRRVYLHAHHIKPFATHPELRFDTSNGLTLCKECHSLEPKGSQVWNIQRTI